MAEQSGERAERSVGEVTLAGRLNAVPVAPLPYPVPEPDDEWQLAPFGFAHVFYGEGNSRIERPVLMADGFNLGRSDLKWLYAGLDRDFPLLTELRRSGRDVILLGFEERTASILENAEAAMDAIRKMTDGQLSSDPVVGGFSMGGLITRYALAKLEHDGFNRRIGVYFSYDSPHRGGVVPIGIQAFAHFIGLNNPLLRQLDSPAARQMLWRHYDQQTGQAGIAPERSDFIDELNEVGGWPSTPRLLALANGRGDGTGLEIPPAETALKSEKVYPGTTFYVQAQGRDVTVAELKRAWPPQEKTITTSGFPELDGAPGGSLRSYGILADVLTEAGAEVDLRHPEICFVPSVSAVAIRDIDEQKDLYADIDRLDPSMSEVDEFVCSSTTTEHTAITEELCRWLMERLPD